MLKLSSSLLEGQPDAARHEDDARNAIEQAHASCAQQPPGTARNDGVDGIGRTGDEHEEEAEHHDLRKGRVLDLYELRNEGPEKDQRLGIAYRDEDAVTLQLLAPPVAG